MYTTPSPPPADAIVLFNGMDLNNWTVRDGKPAGWRAEDGILCVVSGTGDVLSAQRMADFYLHLEFRCPDMPEASGQAKGNSGVYLQGRYEIQVLDSFGVDLPSTDDCGAIYDQFAPLVNACWPAMQWQAYDMIFRAPRVEEGSIVEHSRLTVFHNGRVIHNNVQLLGVTGGALDEKVGEPGPLRLQDHGDVVAYRNIWALPLALRGSLQYDPG